MASLREKWLEEKLNGGNGRGRKQVPEQQRTLF
jgi:hypothetical protein